MKTVVKINDKTSPCLVLWVGKTGMIKGGAKTYCEKQVSIETGFYQVPDKFKVCEDCQRNVQRTEDELNAQAIAAAMSPQSK